MRITKYGHCCLLIEVNGTRIITDPGSLSTTQQAATDIDLVLITHEHSDHLHIPGLQQLLINNPQATVVAGASVADILADAEIPSLIMTDGDEDELCGISIRAVGELHAAFHSSLPQSGNTGFLIAGRLFYPGDAFTHPHAPVDILALPVAGPWMNIGQAIDYALLLQPRNAFPVHDAVVLPPIAGFTHGRVAQALQASGSSIQWVAMQAGDTHDFS